MPARDRYLIAFPIYIPLWSDSIAPKETRQLLPILIYIPLWSDSIPPRLRWPALLIRFTFHYGRIQSRCSKPGPIRHNCIYIPLWSDSIARSTGRPAQTSNLHSIMVGFNRDVRPACNRPDAIYIPLWSDSISDDPLFNSAIILFTFHYGRIQS